jgi:hypothetical protein
MIKDVKTKVEAAASANAAQTLPRPSHASFQYHTYSFAIWNGARTLVIISSHPVTEDAAQCSRFPRKAQKSRARLSTEN